MIHTAHKSGPLAILVLVLLVIPVHFLQYIALFVQGGLAEVSGHFLYLPFTIPTTWYQGIMLATILVQAIWFGRLMNRFQFFERYSLWPVITFLMLSLACREQMLNLNLILFNFVFLYIYNRIFNLSEDEMSNYQLYMDVGTVYAFGLLWLPEAIYLLPLFILTLNQFAVFDVNRLLLFITSILMLLIPAITLTYLYLSPTWAQSFLKTLAVEGPNLSGLENPELLYPYLFIFAAIVVFTPTMLNQLGFMQNQNRKMVNVMLIHLLFGLVLVFFSRIPKAASLTVLAIPISFLFAFGSGHLKKRYIGNIMLLLLMFALVFTQYVYIFYKGRG